MKLATTTTDKNRQTYDEKHDVSSYVKKEYKRFRDARQVCEETWLEAWGMYLSTPEAQDYLRDQVLRSVGDVNADWRHKITTGKAFEAIETIHAYLMSATFPNKNWFDVVPAKPGEDNLLVSRLIKRYVQDKLTEGKFRAAYANFLRQLLITGNSVLALPWRVETAEVKKKVQVRTPLFEDEPTFEVVSEEREVKSSPDFEVLDMFDCFYDPNVTDPNRGAFIRKLTKTKADILNLLSEGYYYGVDPLDVVEHKCKDTSDTKQDMLSTFQGVTTSLWSPHQNVELLEYWGDIHLENKTYHDVVVTIMGNEVLRFEQNPYWCGRPFVIGTYIPTARQPYAMGALQPNLGMLHELNIITNQRLDNLELAIDQMYTLRSDGLLQPEDVYTEPGKVFLVSDHGDLQPLANQSSNFSITYQESSFLESTIDKNFGTGNYVGANAARSGERVTAAEVAAVREAGGNRLSGIHKHIEETSLLVLLEKVMHLVQQFTDQPGMVRVAGDEAGAYEYYELDVEDLQKEVRLVPIGSDHVIERKQYIEDRLTFIQAVAQVPEMGQLVDYKRILVDLLQHWGFEEPEAYLKQQDQQAPANPQEALLSQAKDVGGQAMSNMLQNQLQADGGTQMMSEMYNTPNADQMQQELMATTPNVSEQQLTQ
ncbi:portal protein [Leptolyngbya phage Lbo-JY12]